MSPGCDTCTHCLLLSNGTLRPFPIPSSSRCFVLSHSLILAVSLDLLSCHITLWWINLFVMVSLGECVQLLTTILMFAFSYKDLFHYLCHYVLSHIIVHLEAPAA